MPPRRFLFLKSTLKKLSNLFLDAIFPWQCVNCEKESLNPYPLCRECFEKIPINSFFICPACGKRISSLKNCSCRQRKKISALGVVSSYENQIIKKLIFAFKYQSIISVQTPLSFLIKKFLDSSCFFKDLDKEKTVVIPVPLHKIKRRQRRFNQAELLAKKVAIDFSFSYSEKAVIKIKNNPPQAKIKHPEARKENIKNTFKVIRKEEIKNKIVILVDDVYTTGATMEEIANILKDAGAKKIIGLVLASGG